MSLGRENMTKLALSQSVGTITVGDLKEQGGAALLH